VSLPVAILAGGLATRLHRLTERIAKALVEVAGRPFVVHQLELLRRNGLTDIVLCLGHLGDQVRETLGDGARWGVRVRYSSDGQALLGTGGALRRALPPLGDAFFVLYGDSYLDCDYAAVERAFRTSGMPGLMTVYRNDDRWDRSNVLHFDGRTVRYDKHERTPDMRHIDYGLGAFQARVLGRCPAGKPLDLSAVYRDLVAEGQLAAREVTDRFYEIGSPEGLAETRRRLASTCQPAHEDLGGGER